MQLGQIERRQGNREAARKAFQEVADHHPDRLQALVEMAFEERALGRPRESEAALARALARDPGHAGALLQLAEHACLAGKDRQALAHAHRCIAAHPGNPAAYLAASRALAGLARIDDALGLLDHAASLFGAEAAIAARRVELFRTVGLWHKARTALEASGPDALRSFPMWWQRVQLDISMGEHAAAARALEAAPAATAHETARVCLLRGQLAEALWQPEAAARHYRDAIELDPSDSVPHGELARVCLLLLEADEARQHLRIMSRLQGLRLLLPGRSVNVSQTYLGRVLNEFVLDRAALDRLRAARSLQGTEHVQTLMAIVRDFPDNTAAAILLLVALRRCGQLATPGRAQARKPATAGIPRRIVQYWDARVPPTNVSSAMQSWPELNPGFEHRLFDDARARAFIDASYPTDVLRAYVRAQVPAQKADLLRLAYLVQEGGFYADADDRCVGPIEPILRPDASLIASQDIHGAINNSFLGAAAGDPIIRAALDLAVQSINRGDHEIVWLSSGPGLMSRVLARMLAEPASSSEALARIQVLDRGELARAVAVHCRLYRQASRRDRQATGAGSQRIGSLPPAASGTSIATSSG
jgi:mannosyltransferase OCH1-like enzyme